MLIGYARVSTADQNPDHQIDALRRAGVAATDIYVDHASGAKASRPQLDIALRTRRDGDTLKITRLDGLGRSVLHLVTLGAELASVASGYTSSSRASTPPPPKDARCSGCCPSWPSSNANLSSRTRETDSPPRAPADATAAAAHALTPSRSPLAQQLYHTGEHTVQQIADLFGVPRTTVYGHLDPNSTGKRPTRPHPQVAARASTA